MCRRCNDKASTRRQCERAPLHLVNTMVCLRSFLQISINFLRAISRRAASAGCCGCHAVGVIVRNEIIEMFPSSSSPVNTFPDFFFFYAATACALFWLRLCVSKWARHMLECAYVNEFVYQSDSRWACATQRVVSPLLTFPQCKIKMFYAFFSPALFSFILFLFIYFCAVLFPILLPLSSSCTTSPQFINNVFIYHENLFWN